MSKKEIKNKENSNMEQKPEKVITKYDRKVQKRAEQKKQAQREAMMSKILGILLVVVLAAIVISFPVRNYLAINGAYIKVAGETISRIEYEYNYNVAKTNYISTYGSYLQYMGVDLTKDFDGQMYTQLRTWKDYFDELAVENIKQNKAMVKEAKAAGFEYDTTEEYRDYMAALEANAKAAGMTDKAFIQSAYGELATEKRVKPFIEKAMYASAYYKQVYDEKIASPDEIRSHYELNTDEYDSVDYYVAYVDAVLPTDPTDGGAAIEGTDNADATGSADAAGNADAADITAEEVADAYKPSDEEIAAAMETAKTEVEQKAKDIRANGNLTVNVKKGDAIYILRDWLFDAERKEGDSTIIEDAMNSRYYAVEFVKRYLKESLSADIRVVSTADGNADAIYEEWSNGEATEESFAAICDKYNDAAIGAKAGGLYEGLKSSGLASELQEWIFDEARVAGETAVIKPEGDNYNYVVYYVAPNRPEYVLEIESEITGERMKEYVDALVAEIVVDDPKDNLKYPERIEAEQLLSAEPDTTEAETEGSDAASAEDSAQ